MKESVLKDKSYSFALRIVKLYKYIVAEKKEYVLSKQILRSGTSIGVNVEEGNQAQSKSDFVHKLTSVRDKKRLLNCCYSYLCGSLRLHLGDICGKKKQELTAKNAKVNAKVAKIH